MAAKKSSEVDKLEDSVQEVNLGEIVNVKDPDKEVILAVMKILFWEEEWALVSEMNEYRNNLSQHVLIRLSELEGQLVDMARFGPSFKAGWQEWKRRGKQQEESLFAVFLNAMNADTQDSVTEIASHGHCFFLIVVLQMTLCGVHLNDLLAVFSPLLVASTWG